MKNDKSKSRPFWLKALLFFLLYGVMVWVFILLTAPFINDSPSDFFLALVFIVPLVCTIAIVLALRMSGKEKTVKQETIKSDKNEKFFVTGTAYYKSNIAKLAISNPDWKSTKAKLIKDGKADSEIYRFSYVNKPVKLIPESSNPHDPNAVMVMIAGEKVGYISREDNKKVKYILEECNVKYISGFIGGGQFKYIDESGELVKEERPFSISVTISYYG